MSRPDKILLFEIQDLPHFPSRSFPYNLNGIGEAANNTAAIRRNFGRVKVGGGELACYDEPMALEDEEE